MRWDQNHKSSDVVDRRGQGGGAGLLGLIPLLIRSPLGLVGTLIVVGLYVGYRFFLGGGLGLSQDSAGGGQQTKDESIAFVSFVLDDVQKTWERKYPGGKYQKAKLVVFTGSTPSACGTGRASTGPFYCPADRNAYIDLSFYDALRKRLGAPGDFAQAYVIAHEIGHHVQNLMGTSAKVHAAPKAQQAGANGLSVRLELQADCYAGVWGHDTSQRKLLEEGDLEEALTAAAAIGDDRLQKQATGTVSPETFSHGTSAQRVKWFQRGYKSGDPAECDTFSVPAP